MQRLYVALTYAGWADRPGERGDRHRARAGNLPVTHPAIWFGVIAAVAGCGRLGFGDRRLPTDATSAADANDAALPCVSANITDEFTDGVAGPLFASYAGTGMMIGEVNGQLVASFAPSVGAGQYAGYDTGVRYPLEGLCVVLHVIAAPSSTALAYFKLRTITSQQIEFLESTDQLLLRTHTGPAGSVVDNALGLPFSLPTQAFWRLRNQAGTAYWDISSDGLAFTQLSAFPGFFTEPDAFIGVGAGAYSAVTNVSPVIFESISW